MRLHPPPIVVFVRELGVLASQMGGREEMAAKSKWGAYDRTGRSKYGVKGDVVLTLEKSWFGIPGR